MLDHEAMTWGYNRERKGAPTRRKAILCFDALVGDASGVVDTAAQCGTCRRIDHAGRHGVGRGIVYRDWDLRIDHSNRGGRLLAKRLLDRRSHDREAHERGTHYHAVTSEWNDFRHIFLLC